MINHCHTLLGKFLQTLNNSYQLTLLLLGLLASPQLLAQDVMASVHAGYSLIIDELVCRGNENTQCEFITKKYYQDVGEFVDPDEIYDARLRLGTLQQFKNVTIVLEKAKQHGHVNVVFVVDEAQHIQYSLGTGYQGFDLGLIRSDSISQSVGVTDFNFLGSAKELSFDVSSFYNESRGSFGNNSYSHGYNANLSYYDPHLNNSVDYFLLARASHQSLENSFPSRTLVDSEGVTHVIDGSFSFSSSSYSISLGRRFASHSYISVGALDSNAVEDASLFMAYGWDSTDDKLFATKGSAFRSELTSSLDGDSSSLLLSYEANMRLSEDYVLGYQVSDSILLNHPRFRENQLDPQMTLSLSDIDSSQRASGKYTGWRYQVSSPLRDMDTHTLNFGVSYIYQTDKFIMNFSLSYHPDFGGK